MRNFLLAIAIIILMGWIFYCTNTDGPRIEKSLTEKVSEVLKNAPEDFSGIQVTADIRHITLHGNVDAREDIEVAVSLAEEIYGVKTVNQQLTVLEKPVVKIDYQTGLQLDEHRIVLNGMVPSEDAKRNLLIAVKNFYPDHGLVDRLIIQNNAPDQWLFVMKSLLNNMQTFTRGNAVLLNHSIAVSGEVDTQEKSDLAVSSLKKALGEDFQLNPIIKVIRSRLISEAEKVQQQAINCQKEFEDILSSGEIKFKTNSDDIQIESFSLLDTLVDVAEKCPEALVEVAGHTDSQGAEIYNQQLSERRARSVADYLVAKGIESKRLSSAGYGELQPIADNMTADGRAKNRRIELTVMEK
ncbi:MAG: OmpA family protein [Cellvibrionaceae bacterium]